MISAPEVIVKHLNARAPAKLIISGEHSVLYGQPALAMAVDRYTKSTITWQAANQIQFNLTDLDYVGTQTITQLRHLCERIQLSYAKYLHGQCTINLVIKKPYELLQYAVATLLEKLDAPLENGLQVRVNSTIPIGCGLGSSAAALSSTLCVLANFLNIPLTKVEQLRLSREIESLQHGRSSGLDLHLTTMGGCVQFQNGVAQTRSQPKAPMYIVNTGTPMTSTGECVSNVAKHFKDLPLVHEFGVVTSSIDAALNADNLAQLQLGIKANHRLLQRIGVVPEKVATFITAIEQAGGAAKICGAGAINGSNAGVVLVVADADLRAMATSYGYIMQQVNVDTYGTKIL